MIVYRIFNKINKKSYIGQSIHSFNERYPSGKWWVYTHNEILKNSVNKNGLENFEVEILENNIKDINLLNEKESYYAELYNSYKPYGYNLRGCGENKFITEEQKISLSNIRLGTEYKPTNKSVSLYKGVYYRKNKKSWVCRFQNRFLIKSKYANSEIEAAEIYDKVCLYLYGKDCFINFEEKRQLYLELDLKDFYENEFLLGKKKRTENYFKDDSELLNTIKPLIWKMSISEISKFINITVRRIQLCLIKHNVDRPKNGHWQKKINKKNG